jgi:hypothetical protein
MKAQARTFKVIFLLNDRELATFRRLAIDPRVSVDDLHEWLRQRGHTISRTAVHNFRAHARDRGMFPTREALDCRDDAALRRKIRVCAEAMSGGELASLAVLAAFLARAAEGKR